MELDIDYVTVQTEDIVISGCQAYMEESEDSCGYYLRIENNSDAKIQILSKDFSITDDKGNSYFDHGIGFKGEIPELEPGEYFEFSNTLPVNSSFAVLYGSCQIITNKDSEVKNIKIPALNLIGNQDYRYVLN